MSKIIFVRKNHITSRIMHFLQNNFFLGFNILLWEEKFQSNLDMCPTCLIFRSKLRWNFPCSLVTGGYSFAVFLLRRWGFNNRILIIIIIHHIIWFVSLSEFSWYVGCFTLEYAFHPSHLPPPYELWFGWRVSKTNNPLWSFMIANDCFWSVLPYPPPPPHTQTRIHLPPYF